MPTDYSFIFASCSSLASTRVFPFVSRKEMGGKELAKIDRGRKRSAASSGYPLWHSAPQIFGFQLPFWYVYCSTNFPASSGRVFFGLMFWAAFCKRILGLIRQTFWTSSLRASKLISFRKLSALESYWELLSKIHDSDVAEDPIWLHSWISECL